MERSAHHQAASAGCPRGLAEVDLFGPGAAVHWYDAYSILHAEVPVLRLPGEGLTSNRDAIVLTKHTDISRVMRDWERHPPTPSIRLEYVDPVRDAGGGLSPTQDLPLPDDATEPQRTAQERFPLAIPAWWTGRA